MEANSFMALISGCSDAVSEAALLEYFQVHFKEIIFDKVEKIVEAK